VENMTINMFGKKHDWLKLSLKNFN
jgi:hypothetical protein